MTTAIGIYYLPLIYVIRDETKWQISEMRGTEHANKLYQEWVKRNNPKEHQVNQIVYWDLDNNCRIEEKPNRITEFFKKYWSKKIYTSYQDKHIGNENHQPLISERHFWWWMKWENTPDAYEEYLVTYPNGIYIIDAWNKLYKSLWKTATHENTIVSYQKYLSEIEKFDSWVPGNKQDNYFTQDYTKENSQIKQKLVRHINEANRKTEDLKTDDNPFIKANKRELLWPGMSF